MKLLIHIGYPKAGSTWLQSFFSSHKELFHIANRREISENFGHRNLFDFNKKIIFRKYSQFFKICESTKKVGIISSEFLSGNLYLNGGMDSKVYADRLKQIFPKAKILIIIREQSSFLYSLYKHDISYNGGFWNINEFLNPKWHFMRRSCFHPRFVLYSGLINYYQNLFGGENVLILPFELLKTEKNKLIIEISRFLGLNNKKFLISKETLNESRYVSTVYLQRMINRFFTARRENTIRIPKSWDILINRKFFRKFNFKIPLVENFLEQRIKSRINNFSEIFYKNDNKKLQKLINFELKKYNYKV